MVEDPSEEVVEEADWEEDARSSFSQDNCGFRNALHKSTAVK